MTTGEVSPPRALAWPPAWLDEPSVRRLAGALGLGDPNTAPIRVVGGTVRDYLAGEPLGDLDIATPLQPETVMQRLTDAGIRAIPTGIDHGTVTAISDHLPIEITTLRRDVSTDGRRATVAFSEDWREDASRRDFTINALSVDPEGRLYDYFDGLRDLEAGEIRFIGTAGERIREDYLRILRFFRFHARFGKGDPPTDGLAACRLHAARLAGLSGERIRQELLKLLETGNPVSAVAAMSEIGVFQVLFDCDAAPDRMDRLIGLEREYGQPPDALRRLASLLPAGVGASVTERLRASRQERDRLVGLLDVAPPLGDPARASDRTRTLYRLGPDRTSDLALLHAAEAPGDGAVGLWIAAARKWTRPTLPVCGDDVLGLGTPRGRKVGELLAQVEDWWLENEAAPSRDDCLARLRSLIARDGHPQA